MEALVEVELNAGLVPASEDETLVEELTIVDELTTEDSVVVAVFGLDTCEVKVELIEETL